MPEKLSGFQERLALLLGGGTLLALSIRNKRPVWGGLVLAGMGALLFRDGLSWLRSCATFEGRQKRRGVPSPVVCFDIVDEGSEGSFPASDPPAWSAGAR
ncbi:MAG TPA: hypothetical protein VGV35_21495 [Bryobacteraceae bacterium]|nr:hypothetical protein [Bryobacteraceae bacterium]